MIETILKFGIVTLLLGTLIVVVVTDAYHHIKKDQ